MKFRNKIINALVMIPTILAIILVSYNTKTIRKSIGVIIDSFFNEDIARNIRVFYENNLISIFKIIILLSIISLCIFILALWGHDSIRKNDKDLRNSDNKLFKGLYKYLEEEKKRCFLITGYSGSGKTYNLKKFLDEYLKYNRKNVYNISCFGISTKTEVMSNIKSLCENLDKTYRYNLLKLIKLIPVVGEILFTILKRDYSLKDIKKGSIFVFDDFERISPITNKINCDSCSLDALENKEDSYSKYKMLEKYNIVTGLINELIERYNMKVIVLCNAEVVDTEYFREIFDGKLECIRYNIPSKFSICRDIIDNDLESIASIEDNEKEYLEKFFNTHEDEINRVWSRVHILNNRVLSSIINAFIEVVYDIGLEGIKDIEEGIFYSIFIANVSNYDKNLKDIKGLKLGENIINFDKRTKLIYINSNRRYEYLEEVSNKEGLVWCGVNMALSNITGMPINKKLFLEEIKEIKNYKCEIENYMSDSIRDLKELKSICDCEDNVCICELVNAINNVVDIKDEDFSILKDILKLDIMNYDIKSNDLENIEDRSLELEKFFELVNKSKLYDILLKDEEIKDILFKNITENLFEKEDLKIQKRDTAKLYDEWKNKY